MHTAPSMVAAHDEGPDVQPARRRIPTWLASHPHLVAAVIYAVLSVVMVGQGLVPGRTLSGSDSLLSAVPWQSTKPASVPGLGTNFELADSANVFQPMLRYTRSTLPTVPLWNPFLMAGRPLLADGQSAVFSPFSVPTYVLPFWKSLAVVAILKLFLGAFGAYVLGRMLGMRFGGALLCGLVFAFGTFFVVWLAWPLTSVYAFIPWALAATELVVRRPGALPAAGLATVIGLQFLGGHPESSFHLVFATVVFFIFRTLVGWRRAGGSSLRALVPGGLAFALGLAGGAALAALVLGPFIEFVLHSGDLARRQHSVAGYWPRKYIGALFLHDYWGRPTQVDLEAFMQVRGWYAGAATLMLALGALLLRRTAERIAVLVFALFCVCMVIGLPPVFHLVSSLPGFSAAHNERLLIYVLLSLALLAGWGLDDLSAASIPQAARRTAVLVGAAVIFCIPIVWLIAAGTLSLGHLGSGLSVAWGFAHPPLPAPGADLEGTVTAAIVRDSSLLIWLPLAGIALGLIALRLRPRRGLSSGAFVVGMLVVLSIDLFRANMGFNPAIPIRTASPPRTGSIRYLEAQRPNRFVGVSTAQLSQPLPADLAMMFGLYDARGYDFPVEKRFDALWRGSVAPGAGDFTQPEEFADATPAALRALNLLSVSDLLVGPLQAARSPLRQPGLRVAYRGSDAVVYHNANALPRAFLVGAQQPVSNEAAALSAVTAPGFDGRRAAITESQVPGIPTTTGSAPGSSAGTARLVRYGAEDVTAVANAQRPALFVLTDSYYPGWNVTVDGRPARLLRVDYLLRGVVLPAGRHTIAFHYSPASWQIGCIISALAVVGLLLTVAIGLRARRRHL